MQDIFKYFFVRDDDNEEVRKKKYGYATWFIDSFPMSEFEKEDKVMYDIVKTAVRIKATLKEKYIRVYIASMLKEFIVKNKITIPETETLMLEDTSMLKEATSVIGDLILGCYDNFMAEEINVDDFVTDAKEWMMSQKKTRIIEICKESYKRLNVVTKHQIGVEDTAKYLEYQSKLVNDVYSEDTLAEIDRHTNHIEMRPVIRFSIPELQSKIKAVYSTELCTIAAGPGVGKTTFAVCDAIYTSAVKYKQNCMLICMEQTQEVIEAMLVARHVASMSNKTLSYGDIAKKQYKDEKILQLIEIAKHDLFESGRYGKIFIRDKRETFYLETMESTLDRIINLEGPFDCIMIDHMAVLQQQPGPYIKQLDIGPIVKQAYIRLVKYAGHKDVAILAINQLDREGTDLAAQGKTVRDKDFAGGMETIRSSDIVLVIERTPQMEINNMRRIYSKKVREGKPVTPTMMKAWMGCGFFKMIEDDINLAK